MIAMNSEYLVLVLHVLHDRDKRRRDAVPVLVLKTQGQGYACIICKELKNVCVLYVGA